MFADTFIKRPVTAIVISIVLVIVGILAMLNLPISKFPDITPPTVSVTASFTGADAITAEQTVATQIETNINGSPGMEYMTSNSTSTGAVSISVSFAVGTDINIATLDVQNRVSIAQPFLPQAVQRLGVTTRKRNPSIFMALGIYSPKNSHDAVFLGNYTDIYIKDVILRTPGVGDVLSRAQDFSMRVWINPDKLSSFGLTPADVTNAISAQNMQVAVGSVGSAPQPQNQAFEYTVLTNGRLSTPTEFGNIVVKANATNGSLIYLKDVARIELGAFDYTAQGNVNGNPAAFMLIYLAPGANALATYDNVIKNLETMKKNFPSDMDYAIPLETASVVTASIDEVIHTFVEALILVIIVVFLFLQSWRATLIPVLAIPVTLIATFIFFYPFGFTLNTLTLFAFVLAIGIVVDDAIVVVEAVQHYLDHEKIDAKEATHRAMKDISAPVIAIALILAAVFVPVSFIPGISGRLYQQFAITIAVSVLISAFIALTLTPALSALMLKPTEDTSNSRNPLYKFFNAFNRWFGRVTDKYTKAVSWLIKHTVTALVILIVFIVGMIFLFKAKPSGFLPSEDEGRLYVAFQLPEGSSMTRTKNMLNTIIKRVQTIPEIKLVGGLSGFNAITQSAKSNSGTLFVSLKPWDERLGKGQDATSISNLIYQKTGDLTTQLSQIVAVAPPPIDGLGSAGGETLELLQTTSNDSIQVFEELAKKFQMMAMQRPEIKLALTFFTSHTPVYKSDLKRDQVAKYGVNISDAYGVMSTLMGSTYVNDVTLYGRNFRVMAMADSAYRSNINDFNRYYVKNSAGGLVPMSSLIETKLTESPATIFHYNIYRNIEFTVLPNAGYSSAQVLDALTEVAQKVLPNGYDYAFSNMSREELAAGNMTVYVFIASFVFVFLFMAALYESWAIPFAVILAVPIGIFGAILTITFTPTLVNDIYFKIGLLTVIGLAAKNAILIVEYAKERIDVEGMPIIDATLMAVSLRLRPIMMTSLAFILGVLPLAFASGAAAIARSTLGWTVCGGMIAASSIAIFLVPVLFALIAKGAYSEKELEALRIKHAESQDGSDRLSH
ncbi:efflux RND transporter permease subunit [Rhizosphaericola mali]|uniref:Efflux RND transporter permease subunit n=1 Tax=Rhizosphaericola mali TaxID=2545455 RepID=A0A5P2G7S7_9BACT|nr:efflux RND transporter permease subunit [Rhizosphaericola mali]QES87571.1 efflux RND transporter permease subunit [Rhizosphaericola mali]